MDTPLPPEDTSELVQRLDRGDLTAIDEIFRRHHDRMLSTALEPRHRYGLSDADLGDDDAVSGALLALCRLAMAGKLKPIGTRRGFWERISSLVQRQFRLARDRLRRQKRGGAGIARPGRRRPADPPGVTERAIPRVHIRSYFDELDEQLPPILPAEKWIDDADEFQHLLVFRESCPLRAKKAALY